MKRNLKIILASILFFVMITGSASAVSHSDEDGDGVNEPGEVITLIADDGYIDDLGNVHAYTAWHWDFDGDYVWDDTGRIITHIFPEEGTYTITLMYINSGITIEEVTIEVNTEEPEEPHCYKFKKIKKIFKWLNDDRLSDEVKIKLILKHLKKKLDIDLDTDDLDEIKEFLEDSIEDLKDNNKKLHRHHCGHHGHRGHRGRKRCK